MAPELEYISNISEGAFKLEMKYSAQRSRKNELGFTLVELVLSVLLSVIMLGIAAAAFSGALGSRAREASKTDAITSTEAALNVMTREIGNSGYGLTSNGIVLADSNDKQLHIRA